MAVANRIAGVCYLKVDGAQYNLRGNLKVNFSSSVRTGVAGQDSVHGFTEAPMVPSIEADISDVGGLSLEALYAISESTVTAELANGKVYVLRQAWFVGEISVATQDGTIPVKFEGKSIEEFGV